MAAPAWAVRMMAEVLCDAGETQPVELFWRQSRPNAHRNARAHSSGRAMLTRRRIAITAGTERDEQQIVLLHEIAHIVSDDHTHGDGFYRVAWSIYLRYLPNIPRKRLLQVEGSYRKEALVVAADMGIRGAKSALARRGA